MLSECAVDSPFARDRFMSGLHRVGYVLVLILAVVPAVFRGWRMPLPRGLDPETVQAGQVLFHHEWYPGDPLAAGGDGLGPVFNAKSCIACHQQGGPGGSGDLQHNVTLFTAVPEKPGDPARAGVIHKAAIAPEFEEKLNQVSGGIRNEEPASETVILPQFGARITAHTSQRNTPALFGARLIDRLPERILLAQETLEQRRQRSSKSKEDEPPVGRALRLSNGRVGRFGWKAQTASLSDFVQAACANELGLGNSGQAQPQPLGQPDYQPPGLDLTQEQCDQLTAFCASLPPPRERSTWLVCFFAGPILPVVVAVWYAQRTDEPGPMDHIVVAELVFVAAVYWILGVVAVGQSGQLKSANPLYVADVARSLGWPSLFLIALAGAIAVAGYVGARYALAEAALNLERTWLVLGATLFGTLYAATFLMRYLGSTLYLKGISAIGFSND
jgi:hypothetical protein